MKRNEESYAKVKNKEMLNYRNQMGVSQVAMAKKLGLSHRMWNHYEHGTKQVPISVVLSAKYLCKNMDKMDKLHDDIKQHEEPLTKAEVWGSPEQSKCSFNLWAHNVSRFTL